MRRSQFGSVAAGILLSVAAAAPVQAQAVKVGSKNFTEQYIVGELYAAALENAGIKVERKINLGGTLIAHQALVTGEIDVYPEYTGTALASVVKGEISSDPQKVYDQVRDFYEKQFKLTWLKPSGIDNGYVLILRQDTADKYKLKTLSDLAKVAGELTLGAGTEFGDRKDGIPGLKAVYGMEFKDFRQFAKLGLRYDALISKQVDVANGTATDWQIAQLKLAALTDDKHLFPPYFLAPVIRDDVLAANPKAAEALNSVSALLDTDTMRTLNERVEVEHDEARDVAHDFLKSKGVLK